MQRYRRGSGRKVGATRKGSPYRIGVPEQTPVHFIKDGDAPCCPHFPALQLAEAYLRV